MTAAAQRATTPHATKPATVVTTVEEVAWIRARRRLREHGADWLAIWIEPVRFVGADGDELVLEAPAELAPMLRTRWAAVIAAAVDGSTVRVVAAEEGR